MYYEEELIDGVLCWRNDPNGEWMPFTTEQWYAKYEDQQRQLKWYVKHSNSIKAQRDKLAKSITAIKNYAEHYDDLSEVAADVIDLCDEAIAELEANNDSE